MFEIPPITDIIWYLLFSLVATFNLLDKLLGKDPSGRNYSVLVKHRPRSKYWSVTRVFVGIREGRQKMGVPLT